MGAPCHPLASHLSCPTTPARPTGPLLPLLLLLQGQSVEELQAKIKELETMQELMQHELNHVSDAASERSARLR